MSASAARDADPFAEGGVSEPTRVETWLLKESNAARSVVLSCDIEKDCLEQRNTKSIRKKKNNVLILRGMEELWNTGME